MLMLIAHERVILYYLLMPCLEVLSLCCQIQFLDFDSAMRIITAAKLSTCWYHSISAGPFPRTKFRIGPSFTTCPSMSSPTLCMLFALKTSLEEFSTFYFFYAACYPDNITEHEIPHYYGHICQKFVCIFAFDLFWTIWRSMVHAHSVIIPFWSAFCAR